MSDENVAFGKRGGVHVRTPAFVDMRLTDALVKIIYLLSCLLSTGARNHLASVPEKP